MIEPFKANHPGADLVPLVAKLNEVIDVVNGMLEVIARLEAWASSSPAVAGLEAREARLRRALEEACEWALPTVARLRAALADSGEAGS